MTIDYEAEYNNRARVPEHPEILARMAVAAKTYRGRAAKGAGELNVRYGATPQQALDIFYSDTGERAPVAMFIHGGYWRSLAPSAFSQVAAGLNENGVTVALAGYDLCPQVRIVDIVDQMQQACLFLWRRFGKRILVFGHSAGGHLSATTLATNWPSLGGPAMLVPAAMGISGLYDLAPMMATSMNADFRLDPSEARRLSPLYWHPPATAIFDAIVGGAESNEFLRQSRTLAETWGKAGVATRFEAVDGANHFTVIEPLADPGSAMVRRLLTLVPRD